MHKPKPEFNLDVKALTACAPAMAKDETRYYLNGVHVFERDGLIVYEATNGHFLIQVTSEVPQDDKYIAGLDIIIPAFIVNQLSKKPFTKAFGVAGEVPVECVVDNLRLNIEMVNGLINFKLVDGTFPGTASVIPKETSCRELDFDAIGFNTEYIGRVSKSIKSLTGVSHVELTFSSNTNSSPVVINSSSHKGWLAVLMPLRV